MERSALALSEIGGLDTSEIAYRLGTDPAVVRKLLFHARESVRGSLTARRPPRAGRRGSVPEPVAGSGARGGRRQDENRPAVGSRLELKRVGPRLGQPQDVAQLDLADRAHARIGEGSRRVSGRRSSSATSSRRRKTVPLLSPFGVGGMKTSTESTSSTYLNV